MSNDLQHDIALVGPAAEALADSLAGVSLPGAAVIDLAGEGREARVASARGRFPLVGILPDGAPPDALCRALDGFVRAAHAATDLPVLLEQLARRAQEREERGREVFLLRRYEDAFRHVSDGMCVLDDAGLVLSLNPAGCATLGLTQAEVSGTRFDELVAPESAMAAALLWREVVRGGRVLSAELTLQTRDGRKLTLAISAGQLHARGARAIVSFRDVTENQQQKAELRKTKEFLERLIDATQEGVVAADLRGRVLLWNKGAERVTGFRPAEVVGRLFVSDFYPPGQARRIMARLREARLAGQELGAIPGELVAKNGEVIPVSLSAALVCEGERETATVGIFRDLREELRVEGELQKTRERLAVAEKAAVVSELAGAAAHELNQPLTSVLGFSELLLRRAAPGERGREELSVIVREAERMALIVRRIGKIVRYETAPYPGKKRIVDLERSSEPPKPRDGG